MKINNKEDLFFQNKEINRLIYLQEEEKEALFKLEEQLKIDINKS